MWFKDTDDKYHCLHLYSVPNTQGSRNSVWVRLCTRRQESAAGLTQFPRSTVEKELLYIQGENNTVCKSCWFWDALLVKEMNARKEREAEDQRRRNEAQLQLEARQEEQRQQRAVLVAANLTKGKKEVTPRHLITLMNTKDKECDVIYLAYGTVETRHGETHSKAIDTLPPPSKDVLVVFTESELGKQINHLFVGDRFPRNVLGKNIQYEIVGVEPIKPFLTLSNEPEITDGMAEKERLDVYEGKGRNSEMRTRSSDGGKGLEDMARDGGQFGSYPLYDSHSDESDAEGKDEPDYLDLNTD